MPVQPSRSRFGEYRHKVRQRNRAKEALSPHGHGDASGRKLGNRQRGFFELFRAFWGMLRGFRASLVGSLTLLTIGVGLSLIPPAATKLVIDCVLSDPPRPLPAWM